MKKGFRKIMLGVLLITSLLLTTGCSDAETVSYNISKEADRFKVKRRIVFVNLRSDEYLLQITGNCSVSNNSYDELEVTCRVGEDKYQKHFLHISNETTYTIEQLEYSDVSKYDYEIVFRPEAIIPITIETEIG